MKRNLPKRVRVTELEPYLGYTTLVSNGQDREGDYVYDMVAGKLIAAIRMHDSRVRITIIQSDHQVVSLYFDPQRSIMVRPP